MHTSNTENTSLQNKLLDLTCTHANSLHATDCKDCIQLVNDITQLFIEEGWVEMLGRPDFVDNYGNQLMTGKEWLNEYLKYSAPAVSSQISSAHDLYTGSPRHSEGFKQGFDLCKALMEKCVKRASGIGEPQDD